MDKRTWDRWCGHHHSEDAIVFAVKRCIRTESQKKEIRKRNLSVRAVLRREWGDHEKFCKSLLNSWNKKLGWVEFRVSDPGSVCYNLWQ